VSARFPAGGPACRLARERGGGLFSFVLPVRGSPGLVLSSVCFWFEFSFVCFVRFAACAACVSSVYDAAGRFLFRHSSADVCVYWVPCCACCASSHRSTLGSCSAMSIHTSMRIAAVIIAVASTCRIQIVHVGSLPLWTDLHVRFFSGLFSCGVLSSFSVAFPIALL